MNNLHTPLSEEKKQELAELGIPFPNLFITTSYLTF